MFPFYFEKYKWPQREKTYLLTYMPNENSKNTQIGLFIRVVRWESLLPCLSNLCPVTIFIRQQMHRLIWILAWFACPNKRFLTLRLKWITQGKAIITKHSLSETMGKGYADEQWQNKVAHLQSLTRKICCNGGFALDWQWHKPTIGCLNEFQTDTF